MARADVASKFSGVPLGDLWVPREGTAATSTRHRSHRVTRVTWHVFSRHQRSKSWYDLGDKTQLIKHLLIRKKVMQDSNIVKQYR